MSPDFDRDGFVRSAALLTTGELDRANAAMDRVIAGEYRSGREPHSRSVPPGPPAGRLIKIDMPHLCDPDLLAIITHPALAAWLAGITGAEMLQVWAVQLLLKPSVEGEAANVGWHQDRQYWPYWDGEVMTAWLALSEVADDCGPVRMVRGSHAWGEIPAGDFFSGDLAATRSAILGRAAGAWTETAMLLPAGAASLHHRLTVHGSGANRSGRHRRSLAIHLRSEHARPVPGAADYFVQALDDPVKAPVIWRDGAALGSVAGMAR